MKVHNLTSQRACLPQPGAQTRRSQRRKTHKPQSIKIQFMMQNPYKHNQRIPANIKKQLQQFKYISMEMLNTLDFGTSEGGEDRVWSMREAACMQRQQFMDYVNARNHAIHTSRDTIRQQVYRDKDDNPQQQMNNSQQSPMLKYTENCKLKDKSNRNSSKGKGKDEQVQQNNDFNNQLDSLIEQEYNQNLSYSCPYRLAGQQREDKMLFQQHNCNYISANQNINVNLTANVNFYPNFKDDYQSFFF